MITRIVGIATLVLLGQFIGLQAYGQLGTGDSPFERNFGDIKFLDAYFGRQNEKIEVTPGDKNVPFTVVFANVGSQDITGIKGQLQLPIGFSPADGKGALILANSDAESLAGEYFSLTFFVNLDKNIPIQQYPGTVKVDYSRLRESGQRNAFFDFKFKVTGESVLNLKAQDPFLTSITNNDVTVEIANFGTAPLSNVKVVLQNTNTEVTATANPITNVESVVFDQNKWDIGTVDPKSSKKFSFRVYVPENVRSETLRTPMQITYFNAHGDKVVDNRIVDFYINGLIDAKIYDVRVIDLSGKQTIIGEIINEGNINALFAFVTLEPLEDSNIKKVTQFIDEVEIDSPVPFNIPAEFDGEPKYGEHEIRITLRYKDDLRNEHLISHDTMVFLSDTSKQPEPAISDYLLVIVGLAAAAGVGVIISKKIRKKENPTPS
ncbi:MAG TPA: hypothetical protein VD828_02830 [Candidatus Nitrosotenuis sp.]|nr:hypothetical protein [Candidatus Nitrosotenuis sp.]